MHFVSTEGFTPFDCVRTVPKLDLLKQLGLLLSEKQIPQVVVNIRNQSYDGAFGIDEAPFGAGGRAFKSPRPDQTFRFIEGEPLGRQLALVVGMSVGIPLPNDDGGKELVALLLGGANSSNGLPSLETSPKYSFSQTITVFSVVV